MALGIGMFSLVEARSNDTIGLVRILPEFEERLTKMAEDHT